MTKTMNHTTCTHPSTSSARAKCRKARAAHAATISAEANALIDSYYDRSGDAEEIMMGLARIFPQVHDAYYDLDLDTEEIIALARSLA